MKVKQIVFISLLAAILLPGSLRADELSDFARDFWAWRAVAAPLTGDDIPRFDRPAGWTPDWSQAAIEKRRHALAAFEGTWKRMDATLWPIAKQVDYRLMGSALARVRWELDFTRGWQRDPAFYIDETLGGLFQLIIAPPPFTRQRSDQIILQLDSFPATVRDAEANLSSGEGAAAPFARLTIESLKDVRPRLAKFSRAIKPRLDGPAREKLDGSIENATAALEGYRKWLEEHLSSMNDQTAVGRDAYVYFLKNVALMPYTPEQLLAMGQQEWARAVAFQTYEEHHTAGTPPLKLFPNSAAQIGAEARDELEIRRFLQEKKILTVPDWVQHYTNWPMLDYMAPLAGLSVTDDLTGPNRLKDPGIHYIPTPSLSLGYFDLATAHDTRPILVHEGIPGHYFQLVLSWANPDPIRRHYYDSGSNEGIGFYAEEMMLEAGLFDDSPRTREIIYNFARLRALRVEVDVKLALGLFTIEQAADYLRRTVPMDSRTAMGEASSFAAGPGQAISYQIGKLQILKFLADAQRAQGDEFSLEEFHDFVWLNGNVPIALQRWEYLGLRDEIDELESTR
jgi:uncharacterized protein (DUF885 family)